jgi:hypothetical protein
VKRVRNVISGSTTSLRPTGPGRYVGAAFMAFWLIGWVIGEVVAIAVLAAILASLAGMLPATISSWADIAKSSGAGMAIVFLLVWLTFWTIGGIGAFTHLLRSIAGEDRVELTASGVEVVHRAGPFRKRHVFDRSGIRRVRIRPHDKAVMIDSETGSRVLTSLGSRDERETLAASLVGYLGLTDKRATAAAARPPATWDVVLDGDVTRLRKTLPRTRTIRSCIAWLLAGATAYAWYASIHAGAPVGSIPGLVFSILFVVGAALTTWYRREWIVRPGELTFRRSFASWTAERTFRSARLDVKRETDSDNDTSYTLVVIDSDRPKPVHSQLHDSAEVVDLGHWLSSRTGFPFDGDSD